MSLEGYAFILSLKVLLIITLVYADNPNVTVTVQGVRFIGYRQTVDIGKHENVELDKFLGIPFAEPPTGDNRFRRPVPKASYPDPLVAQSQRSGCIQPDLFRTGDPFSEDCLFLDIYAPVRTNSNEKLAVMVWIFGGGFTVGSSDIYVADLLASVGEVIVVTLNYRVSVLGFLNVPGADMDANCGLWDQQLAIKWVHDNIEAFGGNKDRVTLFGESAGAASVIYQAFYPGNKGLFQRIIAESGSSAVHMALMEDPEPKADSFASVVNCTSNNGRTLVKCLRELPVTVYKETAIEVASMRKGFQWPFIPSMDNDFVTISPRDFLNGSFDIGTKQREIFASIDLLTGINDVEGGLYIGPVIGIIGDPNSFIPNKTEFDSVLVPKCTELAYGAPANKVLEELIRSEYTPWDDPMNTAKLRDQVVNMYTDLLFTAPMYRTLNYHVEFSTKKSYMYHFKPKPTDHVFPVAPWLNTAAHGDELLFIFGEAANLKKLGHTGTFTQWEKDLANGMMKLWTNFAKTGDMNKPHNLGLNWQPYTKDAHKYLEINKNLSDSEVKEGLKLRAANLWNKLLPMVANRWEQNQPCGDDQTSAAVSLGGFVSAPTLFVYALHFICSFIQ